MATPKMIKFCRPLPPELLSEIHKCLAFEKQIELIGNVPSRVIVLNNGPRVKRVCAQEHIREAMYCHKWNAADCGRKMSIPEEGVEVKHSGTDEQWNCVRTVFPITTLDLNARKIFYFEVNILNNSIKRVDICIGFCTQQFPSELEDDIHKNMKNSMGIWSKGKMIIDAFCGFENAVFENLSFSDVIGIGIVDFPADSPLKCIATYNGKLTAMVELPAKFANVELFPAVILKNGVSIRANFGQHEWCFNFRQLRQIFGK